MPISPLDFVLLQFGSPGYYQVFLGFLLCCLQLPITFTGRLYAHYSAEPPHRCRLSGRQARLGELNRLGIHKNEWYPMVQRPQIGTFTTTSLDGSTSSSEQLPWILGRQTTVSNSTAASSSSSTLAFDSCHLYLDPIHHWKGTAPCSNGWEFWLPSPGERNLVTEFELVCDRAYLLSVLFYASAMAAFAGAILFGLLADRWGRTRTVHFTTYLFVAASLSAYFAVDFVQFAVFYCLQVFFISGLQIAVFVLLLELLPTPYQLQASILWTVFHVLTSLLVPLLTTAIHDWRYMQLSVAVPSFAFFTYIFVLPASPLWLTVVRHRLPAAFKTLATFGRFNGRELSASQLSQHIENLYLSSLRFVCSQPATTATNGISGAMGVEEPSTSLFATTPNQLDNGTGTLNQQHHSLQHSVNSSHHTHQSVQPVQPKLSEPGPVLRWYLLAHFYLFFVVALIDSEQLLARHSLVLHQNAQVNAIYSGFLQLGLLILAYHLSCWLGGRLVQSLLLLLDGLLIVGAIVLREHLKSRTQPENDDPSFDFRLFLLPPMLMVVARALNHTLTAFTWYYAVKTIPTRIRATGLGFCFFWTQIARMSVPHLIVLSSFLSYNQVQLTVGAMAILGGMLTLLFASVQQRPLPNSLDDLQPQKKQKQKKKKTSSSSSSSASSSSQCNSILAAGYSATYKRYPSYRDLKRSGTSGGATKAKGVISIVGQGTAATGASAMPISNVYSIAPTEMSLEHHQLPETLGRAADDDQQLQAEADHQQLINGQVEVHHHHQQQQQEHNHQRKINIRPMATTVAASASRVNIQELMDMIQLQQQQQQQQQSSLSSTGTRLGGNDTEKSSLSSDNGVSGGGSGGGGRSGGGSRSNSHGHVSLVQLTPSTSFVHTSSVQVNNSSNSSGGSLVNLQQHPQQQQVQYHQNSYIAYSSPSLENDANIYGRMDELNNEVVTVEVGEQPPALRPTSFVFPPPHRPRAGTGGGGDRYGANF